MGVERAAVSGQSMRVVEHHARWLAGRYGRAAAGLVCVVCLAASCVRGAIGRGALA
jgi:hypothetical protein